MSGSVSGREYDVIVLGGGLAGGCLARQFRLESPQIRIAVIEKRQHPVREAAFKVGESSVEIGAHYFQKRLGLEPHLREGHLEKLGLRYFFTQGGNRELTTRFELGPPNFPPVPSFQLDRGRLENYLLACEREAGIDIFDGTGVEKIELSADAHRVTVRRGGDSRTIEARWVVDASGRGGLIKRQLGLARPSPHGANACWFRVKSRIKLDAWSTDAAWRGRVPSDQRWMSTNHLMGPGYWVWLIPLGSGSTSLGIVADGDMHPYHRLNRFDRAMEWLREFEPQFAAMMDAGPGELEDFLALRHFAHGCARVFSPDRWALVGEAGVFTDPFYSPGSDFIAMSNDYAKDLIVRSLAGEDVTARTESFNTTYLRLFDAFTRLYDGQYPIMGNARVMTAKVAWDNACYWSVTALLFFQRRLTRPEFMDSIDPLMRRFFVLHARMQRFLRAWHLADASEYPATASNIVNVQCLRELQAGLGDPWIDDDALRARLAMNFDRLEAFARTWQHTALAQHPGLDRMFGDQGPLLQETTSLLPDPVAVAQ